MVCNASQARAAVSVVGPMAMVMLPPGQRCLELYYYDKIARGYQEGGVREGGVGFGDSGAVARGHMHWDDH